jgi:serine/threonine protein kinase/tetratricopeptide (TPR) repeat protein
MVASSVNAREIFLHAVELDSPEKRLEFLDCACASNEPLRREVERLIGAHEQLSSFMEYPAAPFCDTANWAPVTESAGTVVGPYQLLEQIGEGGFGFVYLADQRAPIRRQVALKIIKPGMDTRRVVARFKAELQTLSLMDHPNIARALDAGETESGRPYFVMELVRGVPITEYCDEHRLSVGERLGLFVQVCHAVQHAHQKGIIHRDIKPSNVLVTEQDGRAMPKVIDFGVARALNREVTRETLFTGHAELIGTPLYMSPEQADPTTMDIDTRSDVYSLGVVLYELLTGTTPFESQRLKKATLDEIRRIIREEDPPTPSTRLSSLGDTRPVVAGHRRVDPARLNQLVCGDLDWIVMMALEKERTRRYETASAMSRDVERYLSDQPVEACPPTAAYRFRKFARRNRAVLSTAGVISFALVASSAISTWQAILATRAEAQAHQDRGEAETQRQVAERRAAEARDNERKARAAEAAAKESDATANEVLDFVKCNIFAAGRPSFAKEGLGRDVTFRKVLDSAEPKIAAAFATRPRVEAQLRTMLGLTYLDLGELGLSQAQLERAYALAKEHYGLDDPFTVEIEEALAGDDIAAGRSVEGYGLLEKSLARRRRTLGPRHPMTVASLQTLFGAYSSHDRSVGGKKLAKELLQIGLDEGWGTGDPGQIMHMASYYAAAGRPEDSARLLEEAIPRLTAKLGSDNPQILSLNFQLSSTYAGLGRRADAIARLEPAYRLAVRSLGPVNNLTLNLMQNLTALAGESGRAADVVRILQEALPALRRELGPSNSKIAPYVINLSSAYISLGRHHDAVTVLEETIAAIPEKDRAAYVNLSWIQTNLIIAYRSLHDPPNARRVLANLERDARSRNPAESLELADALMKLGEATQSMNLSTESERVYREVLGICKVKEQTGFRVIAAKIFLGAALVEQRRFGEAEPLLIGGCDELQGPKLQFGGRQMLIQGWSALAKLYAETGRPQKAIEVCRHASSFLEKQNLIDATNFYNLACMHALFAAALKSASGSEALQFVGAESDRAVVFLKQAVAAGFKDQMDEDHDLDALRERKDFKNLLASLKPKTSPAPEQRASAAK